MSDVKVLHLSPYKSPEENLPKGKLAELLYATDSQKLFYGGENQNIELAKKSDVDSINRTLQDHITEQGHTGGFDESLFYTKEQVDGLLVPKLNKDGDLEGTWQGFTLEEILAAIGTGFAKIEILDEDPINPEPGRIWILNT